MKLLIIISTLFLFSCKNAEKSVKRNKNFVLHITDTNGIIVTKSVVILCDKYRDGIPLDSTSVYTRQLFNLKPIYPINIIPGLAQDSLQKWYIQ